MSDEPDTRELLDITALAKRLSTSTRTVRRLVDERRIPFVRIRDRQIRFLPTDVDEYIAAQRVIA